MPSVDAFVEGLLAARVVDLSQPLDRLTPGRPGTIPFRSLLHVRHGDVVAADGTSFANEMLMLTGHTGTHIDALGHISEDGVVFGGRAAEEELAGGALQTLGIDRLRTFVYRGILVDVAGARGVPQLDGGEPVTAAVVADALERQGTSLTPGVAALVRTGWGRPEVFHTEMYRGEIAGLPGLDVSGAEFLAAAGASLVGADTLPVECISAGQLGAVPVHRFMLVHAGIPLIENLNLEELAADGIYEFAFVIAPLPIVGGTGSPIRPLALVPAEPPAG